MDRLAAGGLGRGDERRDAEIALGGGRRADADRAVGEPHVERVLVRRRVDGDGLDAELVQRSDHADGDLAAVGDEDSVEHEAEPSRPARRRARGRRRAARALRARPARARRAGRASARATSRRSSCVAPPASQRSGQSRSGSSVACGLAPAPSRTSPTTTAFCRGSQYDDLVRAGGLEGLDPSRQAIARGDRTVHLDPARGEPAHFAARAPRPAAPSSSARAKKRAPGRDPGGGSPRGGSSGSITTSPSAVSTATQPTFSRHSSCQAVHRRRPGATSRQGHVRARAGRRAARARRGAARTRRPSRSRRARRARLPRPRP